jgi:predicted thioesterase
VKNPFTPGDLKTYTKIVGSDETARFDSGEVHPFYGTFALAKDAEWSTRLFVLDMKEAGEEGIGTYVNIKHVSPARVGDLVEFRAKLEEVKGSHIHCSFEAFVKNRLVASGKTGQKILTPEELKQLYNS